MLSPSSTRCLLPPLALWSDASDVGIGTILKQLFEGELHPLGFFIWTLTPAEQWYSMFDRKLLATYAAIRHFWSSIEGCRCSFFTNHHFLTQAVCCVTDSWSSWQQCHLSTLTEFLGDDRYLPGSCNVPDGSLS